MSRHFRGLRAAALVLAVMTLGAGCAQTEYREYPDAIVLTHGPGGMVHPIHAKYEHFRASGKRIIIDGQMISADATFAFSLPGACYTRRAVFSPHGASYMGLAPAEAATWDLSHFLPWRLGQWFRQSAAYHDWIGHPRVTYDELREIWPEGACDPATEAMLAAREKAGNGAQQIARARTPE